MIKITHKLSLTTIKRQFVIFRIYTSNINQQSLIFSNSYLQRPSMSIFNVLSSGSSQQTANLIECVVCLFIAIEFGNFVYAYRVLYIFQYAVDNTQVFDRLCFIHITGLPSILFRTASGHVFVSPTKKRKNEKKHIFIHCCYLNNFTSYSLHIRLSEDSFTTPYEMLLICKMPPFRLSSDILSELVFHTCYAAL